MISDVEGIDIPSNAVSKLVNCRGHYNAIRGSRGSMEWIKDLKIPTILSGITFTLGEGDIITISTGELKDTYEGYYFFGEYGGEKYWFHIEEVLSNTEAKVENQFSGLSEGDEFTGGYLSGTINARYYDYYDRLEYMLVGVDLWYRNDNEKGVDRVSWEEVFNPDKSLMTNTQSQIMKIERRLVIINASGAEYNGMWFVEKNDGQPYMYPANGAMPDLPLDKGGEQTASNPSVYRYLYGYSRMKGNLLKTRNGDGNTIQVETPPHLIKDGEITKKYSDKIDESYTPFDRTKDYSQYRFKRPISDSYYYGYSIAESWGDYKKWIELTESGLLPCWIISVGEEGVHQKVYPDFSDVENMNDVAMAIEEALNDSDRGGFRVLYQKDESCFDIYNTDKDLVWNVVDDVLSGDNLSGYIYVNKNESSDSAIYQFYPEAFPEILDNLIGLQFEYHNGDKNEARFIIDSVEYDDDDNPVYFNVSRVSGNTDLSFNIGISLNSRNILDESERLNYGDSGGSGFLGSRDRGDLYWSVGDLINKDTGSDITPSQDDIEDVYAFEVPVEDTDYNVRAKAPLSVDSPVAVYSKLSAIYTEKIEYNLGNSGFTFNSSTNELILRAGVESQVFDLLHESNFGQIFEFLIYIDKNDKTVVFVVDASKNIYKLVGDSSDTGDYEGFFTFLKSSDLSGTESIFHTVNIGAYGEYVGRDKPYEATPSFLGDIEEKNTFSGLEESVEFRRPTMAYHASSNNVLFGYGNYKYPYYTFGDNFYPSKEIEWYILSSSDIVESDGIKRYMASSVGKFRYPTRRGDITHYCLYRTADIFPSTTDNPDLTDSRIENKPGYYGWVDDIPVCEVVRMKYDGINQHSSPVTFDFSADNIDKRLLGETIITGKSIASVDNPIHSFTIVEILNNGYRAINNKGGVFGMSVGEEYPFVIGSETFGMAQVNSNGVMTINSGTAEFKIPEIGDEHQVYWPEKDKTVDIVKGVDEVVGEAYLLGSEQRQEQICVIRPTQRVYGDKTNDIDLIAQSSFWPLKTRFYKPIISSPVAAYTQGIFVTAVEGNSDLEYIGTEDIYRIGYNHSVYQRNNSLEDGVRCLMSVNGVFAAFTPTKTYQINPRNFEVIEERRFGTYYILMPEPKLIHGTIGTLDQFRWRQAGRGNVVIITNEPGVRFFNGNSFDKNVAVGLVQNSQLSMMDKNLILHFNPTTGVEIWGNKNA